MALASAYGVGTLNGNWFEDRLGPAQSRAPDPPAPPKTLREIEPDIAYVGHRYDVLSRIARVKLRETYATPDDNFSEKTTTHGVGFVDPSSLKDFISRPPEKPRLISTETIPEVCYEGRRPIPGARRGFGAVLNRHEENHGCRHYNTSTGDCYGAPAVGSVKRAWATPRQHPAWSTTNGETYGVTPRDDAYDSVGTPRGGFAGRSSSQVAAKVDGIKVGRLCGEDHHDGKDPSADTHIQRAWLYHEDPALSNIHLGGSRPVVPALDNELSLPLGAGQHHRTLANLSKRDWRLARTGTLITKGRGDDYGIAVYQDG